MAGRPARARQQRISAPRSRCISTDPNREHSELTDEAPVYRRRPQERECVPRKREEAVPRWAGLVAGRRTAGRLSSELNVHQIACPDS